MSPARAPASSPADLQAAAKVRPRRELVMVAVQPLATLGVAWLARTRVDPQAIVWSHSAAGVAAAALIAFAGPNSWPLAAALLLLKTLLDNIDGGLARATGRVTEMGRYLDTVLDTLVNALLIAALALLLGTAAAWGLAVGAYLLLMLLLSLDFNLERLYREARRGAAPASAAPDPPGAPPWLLGLFRGFYQRLLAPQDRWIEAWEHALFERLAGVRYPSASPALRQRWSDLWSTASLVNFGLSTQLTLLAALLLIGVPTVYLGALYAMAAWALFAYALRALRFRRSLRFGTP